MIFRRVHVVTVIFMVFSGSSRKREWCPLFSYDKKTACRHVR